MPESSESSSPLVSRILRDDSGINFYRPPTRPVTSSSSSSSSSIHAPAASPTPIRNLVAPGSASSLPISGSTDCAKPSSKDEVPVRAPTPTPRAPKAGAVRHPMTGPEHFEFGEELGGGSWSTVVEAMHPPTSKRYAVKILYKSQLLKEKMTKYAVVEKNALAILSSGDHPGIVRLYSAFHDATSLYLVLSLAPNGDLRELVKSVGSFSLPCARYYTAQIVDTLQWIHSKGILHRDMKPENILLDSEMRIKITDFGSAYISEDLDLSSRASTFVGTAAYVSPELLASPLKTTSQSSDIWAIGCILYYLIVGQSPFLALNDYLSFKKIEALDYTFPDGFDSTAKDLVERILILDPSDRIGVAPKSSPSALREHAFFKGRQGIPAPDGQAGAGGDDSARALVSPADYIDWETLWTDAPVPVESGLVPPSPPPERGLGGEGGVHDPSQMFSWGEFVQEFSLLNADGTLVDTGGGTDDHEGDGGGDDPGGGDGDGDGDGDDTPSRS